MHTTRTETGRPTSRGWGPVVFLLFAACVAVAQAGEEEEPIQMLPADIVQGGDMLILVNAPPGEDRQLQFRMVGGFLVIADLTFGTIGEQLVSAPLPDVPPGDYFVDLSDYSMVIASAPVTVLAPPLITLTPSSGFPGQLIQLRVGGLGQGSLRVDFDGAPLIGPLVPDGVDFDAEFRVPDGPAGSVQVVAEQRIGTRLYGMTTASFERQQATQTTVDFPTVVRPPDPLRPGETFFLSGQIAMPDGADPNEYQWTVVWETEDGSLYPINVKPAEFTPASKLAFGRQFNFMVMTASPGLRSGFGSGAFSNNVDRLGFVYINPDTGDNGMVRAPGLNGYEDYEGIVINGRIDDENGLPLENAVFSVKAKTRLIDPNSVFALGQGNKAIPPKVSGTAALLHGANQFAQFVADAQAAATNFKTPLGCPITLYNGVTKMDGTYQLAFSPEYTEFLSIAFDVPKVDINTPFRDVTLEDEFQVRLAALHLGHGVPQPGTLPSVYTGIVYEFKRDADSGLYNFREGLEGPFNQPFDPNNTLVSVLPAIPAGSESILPSNPYIPFLADPAEPAVNVPVISRLFTFPSRQGTALDNALTEIRLPWAQAEFGNLDAILKLDGQVVGALAVANDESCVIGGVDYSIQVPGLATRSAATPIQGRIEAGTEEEGTFYKDFEIEVQPGPTWFEDGAAYKSANIQWKAHRVDILAAEEDKSNDASVQGVGLGIGDLDNNNAETAFVSQKIVSGQIGQQFRSGITSTEVAGNSAASATTKLFGNGPTSFEYTADSGPMRAARMLKNNRTNLYNRLQNEAPDIGMGAAQTILNTGKIPIFRYLWGIEPIAGATLGADIWFKVLFYYFGYFDFNENHVDVDLIAEPQTQIGVNVFFDFNALFGLISASMSANPTVGIAMPVVVFNNLLDTLATQPCFQFVLDLLFEVSVGPCPLCISGSFNDRVLNEKDPPSCSIIPPPVKLATKAAGGPNPDSLAIANNQLGTTFSIWSDTDGIHVQKLLGGVAVDETIIPAGPGASRPDIAFFQTSKAVAVWSQSSLTPAEFQALVDSDFDADFNDTPPYDTSQFAGTATQHMVYSTWDGTQWGPVMNLTAPSTGEGGVALAACRKGKTGCPAGGEVLAVWHRDLAGDIRQGDIKLYHARFNGMGWTPPQPVDPASTAKDLQPAPLYRNGEPVVFWVRNDNPVAQNPMAMDMALNERSLVYRFLSQAAGVQAPVEFAQKGVASPSADLFSDGTIGLTYTTAGDMDAFVGARRILWVATGENCSAGICTWDAYPQLDQHNRLMYVERPDIVVDNTDAATVLFRQVGVSGNLMPGDPVGLQGFGDVSMIQFTLAELGGNVNNTPLTTDGAVNWQIAATFDPVVGSIMAINNKGPVAQLQFKSASSARVPHGLRTKTLAPERGVVMYELPHLPDLSVIDANADAATLVPGDTFAARAFVANLGKPLAASARFDVEAYWDGPPGVGILAGRRGNRILTDPISTRYEFPVDVPGFFASDEVHRLFVVVNPDQAVVEGDGTNNTFVLEFGRLPTPQGVVPSVDRAGTLAFLDWDAVTDPRVLNYRVYRRSVKTMEEFAVGFTPVNGFADLNVVPGERYEYRVTSVSAGLKESASTEWIPVWVRQAVGDVIFDRGGFEDQ